MKLLSISWVCTGEQYSGCGDKLKLIAAYANKLQRLIKVQDLKVVLLSFKQN